jgi:serine protease Do
MKSAGKLAAGLAAIFCVQTAFGQSSAPANLASAPPAPPPAVSSPVANAGEFKSGDILDALQDRYTTLFERISPSVVSVNAAIPGPTTESLPTAYVWSGFFITRTGDILTTNAHYLQNASSVWVISGNVGFNAEVKGLDLVTDVALLHADSLPKNFAVLDLADSPDLPLKATMVMSVTCKEGQEPGPSTGLVQGYNVNVGNRELPTLYLRTNIPDDGGEGGSPVVDLQGRLVGMMIASLTESRSSLVLPSRAALRVRDDLLTNGKVAYGQLGFQGKQRSDTTAGVNIIVSSVDYPGPALEAGLKAGDEVRTLNGTPIKNEDDLRQAAFYLRPGQDVTLGVHRDGQDIQLTLHAGEMPLATDINKQLVTEPKTSPPTADTASKPDSAAANLLPGVNDPALPPPPVVKAK